MHALLSILKFQSGLIDLRKHIIDITVFIIVVSHPWNAERISDKLYVNINLHSLVFISMRDCNLLSSYSSDTGFLNFFIFENKYNNSNDIYFQSIVYNCFHDYLFVNQFN